jgi:hypothetical protein
LGAEEGEGECEDQSENPTNKKEDDFVVVGPVIEAATGLEG